MAFNIFEVLSKDDKELIHSAFLAFLFRESKENINQILGLNLDIPDEYEVDTEVTYSTGNKRQRFDIQIRFNNNLLIIENKFKAFPTSAQLGKYDKLIKENIDSKYSKVLKFLLIFSKESINKNSFTEWNIIDYFSLKDNIQNTKNNILDDGEKYWFIDQYANFLERYLNFYRSIQDRGFKELLKKENENKYDNLWLRLIFSQLAVKLENYEFVDKIEFDGGATKNPLINIYVNDNKWYPQKNFNFLIQVQGRHIKLYLHYDHNNNIFKKAKTKAKTIQDNIEKIREQEKGTFIGEFKQLPTKGRKNKRNYSSYFIYRENLFEVLNNIKLVDLENYIKQFYEKSDRALQ